MRWLINGIGAQGCGPMGSGVGSFPSLTGLGKGQRRREVEDIALSAATPQAEPPRTPKGLQLTPGTSLILTRSQLARGEMNIHCQTEGEPQNQDNDIFPPHP